MRRSTFTIVNYGIHLFIPLIMTLSSNFQHRTNLKDEAQLILQLIIDTKERYGSSYLIRLLRGDDSFDVRESEHTESSSYGTMPTHYSDRLRNIFRYLIREGLLQITDPIYGVLALTDTGRSFLENPYDLIARYQSLRFSPLERIMLRELREARRALATKQELPAFRVFTDHMLQRLVEEKPSSIDALRQIPGFGDYKINRYGPAVLQAVSRSYEQQRIQAQQDVVRQANNGAHQITKSLFESGLTEAEIAEKRDIQPATVRRHLINLHRTGQIDLTPWIETQLTAETLDKGSTYFRQAESRRLRDAYEQLGLDYDTLRLCRLYVASLNVENAPLQRA